MTKGSKIFVPNRGLGYVSNHIPLQVRYIKRRRMENLVVTCVGKSFHTYGINHFSLLNVSPLHTSDITCMASDTYHIYTSCGNDIFAWRRTVELKHTYKGHKAEVHLMLAFAVHLISVDRSGCLKIWDIKDESIFLELTFNKDVFEISAIVHPCSYLNKILLGSEQGEMQLWNINTSKLIYTFAGWDSAIKCLEQAPAMDVIAVGLANGKIILQNLKFDETIMQFTQDWGAVTSISFRSDGHPIMATGSPQGHIVFWDLEEKRVASQLISAHTDSVSGMMCLPSEPLIITSSPDNTLKLWIFDMTDGGARLLRLREGHSATPTYIRYHGSNGDNILSAAGDSSLRIFNTKTEQFNKSLGRASYNRKASKKKGRLNDNLVMPPIVGFTSETTREKEWDNIVAVHQGLPHVTTWSYDRMKMGEIKFLPSELNDDLDVRINANCVCLTHCGNFAIVGYSNGSIERFNVQSGLLRDKYGKEKPHKGEVCGVSSDILNKIIISGGSDCMIKFWNFKGRASEPLKTIKLEESINFFRSHYESSLLAIALHDFSIVIIDIDTKTVVRKFIGHTSQITDATFSPNSRWLITSAMDCTIRTWDIPSSQLVDQFRTENACVSLDFAPTSEALITAHVDYLGIFLWANRSLYQHISLKALNPDDEIPLAVLPECKSAKLIEDEVTDIESDEFISQEQICNELVTLSGTASSRWQNLLNIDVIRQKNKPKAPPKAPKSAPFFLPTIPSLSMKFDLNDTTDQSTSKLISVQSLQNLSEFGKLLDKSTDYNVAIEKLKTFGPSAIDFEIKSLSPEGGGSVKVMVQFLKCIEAMLKSNNNFELAQAYLGVFLKSHGNLIASEEELRKCIPNVQSCLTVSWNRIQEKIMYNLCVVQNLKNQI